MKNKKRAVRSRAAEARRGSLADPEPRLLRFLLLPKQVLSQSAVIACHSNLSQLVTVAAGSIWWGPWGLCRPR